MNVLICVLIAYALMATWLLGYNIKKKAEYKKSHDFLTLLSFEVAQLQRYLSYEFPPIDNLCREVLAMIYERRRSNADLFRDKLREVFATDIAYRPVPFTQIAPDLHERLVLAPLPKNAGWQVLYKAGGKGRGHRVFVALTPYECNAWVCGIAANGGLPPKIRLLEADALKKPALPRRLKK